MKVILTDLEVDFCRISWIGQKSWVRCLLVRYRGAEGRDHLGVEEVQVAEVSPTAAGRHHCNLPPPSPPLH